MIYETVPKEQIVGFVDDRSFRQPILDFLKEKPGVFFKAREIAKATGLPVRGTQVEVRKAITQLIEIDREPIVSNEKGFSYTEKPEMLLFYARCLEERKQGIERRIQAILRIAEELKQNVR